MKNKKNDKNIRARKRKAARISGCYYFFRIFPINKKKIVFTTFEGDGGYCCNPRYIAEEILKYEQKYELIWLVNNINKEFPIGIKKVKNTFLNRIYHLSTAKVWIDNSRKEYGTQKRKEQLYIQTWHGALEFKAVGKFRGEKFPHIAYLVSEHDSKMIDYLISNSEWCTEKYPEMLLYNGKVLKTGSPRCDILINKKKDVYEEIRRRYNLPSDAKIVMFAPTFRGGNQKGKRRVFAEMSTLDIKGVRSVLENKFGGKWYVFLRLHPQLAAQMKEVPMKEKSSNVIDVSQADDMNELMAAIDVFITDYSSAAFDAINSYIPVFLYADDLNEYEETRGKLMWDMNALPFPFSESNEELESNILKFHEDNYRKDINDFLQKHKVLEDGQASKRVAEVIVSFMENRI